MAHQVCFYVLNPSVDIGELGQQHPARERRIETKSLTRSPCGAWREAGALFRVGNARALRIHLGGTWRGALVSGGL